MPWGLGAVSNVEAYVDDGLGNPDTSYAGRTMLLVYNQDDVAWDYDEPGMVTGNVYAVIQPDGIAYFPGIAVSDYGGQVGEEVHMRAIVEPEGTWTPYFTDDFFNLDGAILAYRENGQGPPSPPLFNGHLPNSPNYFEWTDGAIYARIQNFQAFIDGSVVNEDEWFGYAWDFGNPPQYEDRRVRIEFTPERASGTNFGQLVMMPSYFGDFRAICRWQINPTFGFDMELYSDYSGWSVMLQLSALTSGQTYEWTVAEVEGWMLVYVDGVYLMGQKLELGSGDAGPYMEHFANFGATISFDNFYMETWEDTPSEPPVTSRAFADLLG